jgi:hypothetical protein
VVHPATKTQAMMKMRTSSLMRRIHLGARKQRSQLPFDVYFVL